MMNILCLIVLFCTSSLAKKHTNNDKTLKMVNLVFRHGARTPRTFYPNDPYQKDFWPQGANQLTQYGMRLENNLGKFLRQRYVANMSFINRHYQHKDVVVYSSDADRCIQSAQALLAGLYPPSGYQIWNRNIRWQPVPVHTIPRYADVVFYALSVPCPRLKEIWDEKRTSREYKEMESKNKKFLQLVSRYSGLKVTLENLDQVEDPMHSEITENLRIPSWYHKVWDKLSSLDSWYYKFFYSGDDETSRLLGGVLLGKIRNKMKRLVAAENQRKDIYEDEQIPKLNMWSGHDLTLLSLSAALGVDIDHPNYAASLMLELYQSSDSEYFVEIGYRNDYKNTVTKLKLKGCGYSCPLKEFLRLTKGRSTLNRSKFCKARGS